MHPDNHDHDPTTPGHQTTLTVYHLLVNGTTHLIPAVNPTAATITARAYHLHETGQWPTTTTTPKPATTHQIKQWATAAHEHQDDGHNLGPITTATLHTLTAPQPPATPNPTIPQRHQLTPPPNAWHSFTDTKRGRIALTNIARLLTLTTIITAGYWTRALYQLGIQEWQWPQLHPFGLTGIEALVTSSLLWALAATLWAFIAFILWGHILDENTQMYPDRVPRSEDPWRIDPRPQRTRR